MKKVVVELERKKDLERYVMQKRAQLDKIKQKNETLEDHLVTLENANKGSHLTTKDPDFVRKKNELIKSSIEKEKETIKKCQEFMDKSIKIDEETNLTLSSIGKILGMKRMSDDIFLLEHRSKVLTIAEKVKEFARELKETLTDEELEAFRRGDGDMLNKLFQKREVPIVVSTEEDEEGMGLEDSFNVANSGIVSH